MATPPQPTGSCQLTKVSAATDGGAAVPPAHTLSPVSRTPTRSRTTPSVTRAATLRTFMRAHRMSPKMPASVQPSAATTATHPSGIASIAVRVDTGDDQEAGVARSSRAGTKRRVKAGPTTLSWLGFSAAHPRTQMFLSPFLSRTVVSVAVVISWYAASVSAV